MTEKEKAYDEALERMKSWVRGEHPECFTEAQKAAEFIFPELKESENEKIKKELICFLETEIPQCNARDKYIAWLEKLGEKQKPDGTFVNVDDVREDFMDTVYSVLSDDPTNDRANDIINAFDSLPTTEYGITAQVLKECVELINSTCYEEGTGISDSDVEYTIKVRGLK